MKYIVKIGYQYFTFFDRYNAVKFAETAVITGDRTDVSIQLEKEEEQEEEA